MNASKRYTTTAADMSWFNRDALGLFIHFGINSVPGIEPSWPMKAFGAEDAEADSAEKWTPERYYALAEQFTVDQYDPEKWVAVAKQGGFRYAVLGTMHHDGYCLWPTKTKELHSGNVGPKRDIVGPFVETFRKAGLKVGLYLSLIDWEDPDFVSMPASFRFSSPVHPYKDFDPDRWNKFLRRKFAQVRELLTNYGKIDIMWFDVPGWGSDIWYADEMKMMMLELQPHIICNDRLPGVGDFVTPEQQIPVDPVEGLWETNMTSNESWGFHPDPSRYKSVRDIVRNLCEIRSKGGNLLLNVSPDSHGVFPEIACDRFRGLGDWLSVSGDSIYGSEPGVSCRHFWGPSTRRGNTLYCHLPAMPDPDFELRGIAEDPVRVYLLQNGAPLPFRRRCHRIVIDCSGQKLDPRGATVAVEFATPPSSLEFTNTVFTKRGLPLWDDRPKA